VTRLGQNFEVLGPKLHRVIFCKALIHCWTTFWPNFNLAQVKLSPSVFTIGRFFYANSGNFFVKTAFGFEKERGEKIFIGFLRLETFF